MLSALLVAVFQTSAPTIEHLDRLAQARDVEGLSRFMIPLAPGVRNPLDVVRTNGAYEVGRFGWHAYALKGQGTGDYVVIGTPLTSEDIGERVFERDGDRLRYVPETESFGIRLVRHHFDLKIDVPEKRATLVDALDLTNADGSTGTFLFRMSPNYIVSSIRNKADEPVPFAEASGVVLLNKPGGSDTYTISYSAIVDQPNYAGSIGEGEATLTNDYWYPMVARQATPYDITIHAPAGWRAIGQGDLKQSTSSGSERVVRYKMDVPCVFYSVSAAPFKCVTRTIDGRSFSCYSAQMTDAQMEAQDEFYAEIIGFYNREFGAFPFKGYGAVDSSVYGGGALEAYSFATWGHGSLPSEDAHEPSHTWWGGIIDNTYLGSFWNESFAVFSEGLYHRNAPVGNDSERQLAFVSDANANDSYNFAPIWNCGADAGGVAGTLGYGKGSQVLQMLETLLGTDRMVATMRQWVTQDRGHDVDWADYEAVVESMYPELGPKSFFDDWLRRPGFADLRVSDVAYDSGHVRMSVGFNGPSFRIPLEVMLQDAEGKRSYAMIDLKEPGTVSVPCAKKPVLVSVDRWRRILRKIGPDEEPVSLANLLPKLSRYTDPARPDELPGVGARPTVGAPSDADGKFIVGRPETLPILGDLCRRVGFVVHGNELTYDGTTIDLNRGCAAAIVDLGGGRRCAIGLGRTLVTPDFGRARLALTDGLGRFLRGRTEPKTSGNLTFRL